MPAWGLIGAGLLGGAIGAGSGLLKKGPKQDMEAQRRKEALEAQSAAQATEASRAARERETRAATSARESAGAGGGLLSFFSRSGR